MPPSAPPGCYAGAYKFDRQQGTVRTLAGTKKLEKIYIHTYSGMSNKYNNIKNKRCVTLLSFFLDILYRDHGFHLIYAFSFACFVLRTGLRPPVAALRRFLAGKVVSATALFYTTSFIQLGQIFYLKKDHFIDHFLFGNILFSQYM